MPNRIRRDAGADRLIEDRPSGFGGEEYYRLLEKLPAAAYTCDANGLITYFNRRAVEIWGCEPKLNDPVDRFCGSLRLFAADGEPIRHDQCWMALALREGRDYDNCEIVIERPDGSRVTALAHAHPLHDYQGRLIGAANVLMDITERTIAEEAQGRLVAIVESADDAIIGKDLNGVITDWNRGAERLFGYTAEQAIGNSIRMLMPPERLDEESGILRRVRRGEVVDHYETIRRRKDGKLLDISLSVSPIYDAQGRIVGASKIARDISERKRMEEALREADQRKDEFLAMLSHELRNPLAAIRNSVQLMRLKPDDATREKMLAPLERQVSVLTRLVDDLMDVSRVNSGRVRLDCADIRLNRIVEEATATTRAEMIERGHEFTISPADPDVWISGDAIRLEQIVVNLLTNAVKYTPNGGRIQLIASRDGDEAVLRVRDSGIGIAPDMQPRLFQLFSQASTTLDRAQGGLGIGLALVKYLVGMHGGTVAAFSDGRGKGSEFIVRLPAIAPPASLVSSENDARSAEAEGAGRVGGKFCAALRVLVVDDNKDTADVQAALLQHSGYQVRTAYDGMKAVETAAAFQPHVILLDIGLPEIDGYEVAWRIREDESLRHIVLIAMTGYGQAEDVRRSQAAGFDHHLVKPAAFADLHRVLAKVGEERTRE